MFTGVKWLDPRVTSSKEGPEFIAVPKSALEKLWIPNIFIINLHSIKKHELTHKYETIFWVNNTHIGYYTYLEVVTYCQMSFEFYPLDKHVCYFQLTDFDHDGRSLNFTLDGLDFDIESQVSLLDYELNLNSLSEEQQKYKFGSQYWSVAGFEIKMERKIRKYLVNYFIPSGVLAMVSWVSIFWVHNSRSSINMTEHNSC